MTSAELPLEQPGAPTPREQLVERIRKAKRNKHEDALDFHLRANQLPTFERDYRFAKEMGRQWRFDFACVPYKLALEVEGLVVRRVGGQMVSMGRHANVEGFRNDCEKYAWAAVLGWTVMRFEQTQVKSGFAVEMARRVLAARGWTR